MTDQENFRKVVIRRLKQLVSSAINYDGGRDNGDAVGKHIRMERWLVDEFSKQFDRGVQEGMLRQRLQDEQIEALKECAKFQKGGQ